MTTIRYTAAQKTAIETAWDRLLNAVECECWEDAHKLALSAIERKRGLRCGDMSACVQVLTALRTGLLGGAVLQVPSLRNHVSHSIAAIAIGALNSKAITAREDWPELLALLDTALLPHRAAAIKAATAVFYKEPAP